MGQLGTESGNYGVSSFHYLRLGERYTRILGGELRPIIAEAWVSRCTALWPSNFSMSSAPCLLLRATGSSPGEFIGRFHEGHWIFGRDFVMLWWRPLHPDVSFFCQQRKLKYLAILVLYRTLSGNRERNKSEALTLLGRWRRGTSRDFSWKGIKSTEKFGYKSAEYWLVSRIWQVCMLYSCFLFADVIWFMGIKLKQLLQTMRLSARKDEFYKAAPVSIPRPTEFELSHYRTSRSMSMRR